MEQEHVKQRLLQYKREFVLEKNCARTMRSRFSI